jgi:FAD/FMN-containing dehydrogenase
VDSARVGRGRDRGRPGQAATYPAGRIRPSRPSASARYLRELDALIGRFGFERTFYGHFGDGCLHLRSEFDFRTPEGLRAFRSFIEQAADLVVRHGGSLSGEHGDGQARAELLPRMFGPELVGRSASSSRSGIRAAG